MSRYWLTIHWPHPVDPAEDHHWYVYLQHQYKAKGQKLSPQDQVVFYETARGRPHGRKDGKGLVKLKKGRQAVIGTARVNGSLRTSTSGQNVKEYDDGTHLNWAWEVPCDQPRWGREVSYHDVLKILDRGNVRIRSGLMEIEQSLFDEFRKRLGV